MDDAVKELRELEIRYREKNGYPATSKAMTNVLLLRQIKALEAIAKSLQGLDNTAHYGRLELD